MSHENNIQVKLEYVFIILTIIECNSIYLLIGHSKIIINILWQLLLCMLVVHSFKNISYRNININRLFIFMFMFSSIVILFFICEFYYYPSFPKFYIIKLLLDPILLVIYIINSYCNNLMHFVGYKSLLYRFEKVVLWLSIISIPFWIMSILNIPTTSSLLTSGWYQSNISTAVPSYFDIGFVLPNDTSNILGVSFVRNTGIFAEPSMFSYVLIIALFVELFLNKKSKIFNKRMILLFVSVITTASTTGIIFSILAIFIDIILLKHNNRMYDIIWIFMLPILLMILKIIFLEKKDAYKGFSNSSYAIRSDDIQASIRAWKNHIILGNGINNKNSILSYIQPWRFMDGGNAGISTGITTVLACGGIFLLLFYLLPALCSIFISPLIMNFIMFSLLPLVFVNLQYSYLCIISISFVWACWILDIHQLYLHKFLNKLRQ